MRFTLPRGQRPRWSRWRKDSSGQSMVEFMLAVPIFFALLFGSLEIGMAFKTRSAFQEAAQRAVTTAVAAAQSGDADVQTLDQLQIALASENLSRITAVTIYDADAPNGNNVPTTVNKFTTYQYVSNVGFICAGTISTPVKPPAVCPTSYWPISTRSSKVGAFGNSLTRVGVQIAYDYKGVTGVLPLIHMTQVATALMEPTQY